jgi:hypothetical protein
MGDVHAASPVTTVRWAVWRINDSGNTFVVREHRDRAGRLVVALTARGHKRRYRAGQETTRSAVI